MPDDTLKPVTDATFADEVLTSDVPVLVDFWAEWCPPCRPLARTLAGLAPSYEGRIRFVKVNTDENPETTRAYRIMSNPTMLLFRGGRPVTSIVGNRPAAHLRAALDNTLEPYANR